MRAPSRSSFARDHAPSLHARAADDLRFIRATMERAVAFTAVPGWGGVLMGAVGLCAAAVATSAATPTGWLATWLSAAVVGLAIGLADIAHKLRGGATRLSATSASGFAFSLVPAFFAAACLTWSKAGAGRFDELPALWLLLYGAGVVAASTHTVRAVRWTGLSFLVLGAGALVAPAAGDLWLAAGFGGAHVVFGLSIARRRDG